VKVRVLAPLAAVAAAAGILVPASTAKAPPAASARAAVVSGSLGDVARVSASGDQDASRSAPSKTPKGIGLGGGSASASASRGGGDASASASAEARDVDLLRGLVTATSVTRSASDGGKGVTYDGGVRGLAIGDQKIGSVSSG
jgi:hypothetical protein